MAPDCGVLQEAYLLFHGFLTWPEPCFSASKNLLIIIQQELRAPGSTEAPMYSNKIGAHTCFLCGTCVESIVEASDSPPGVLLQFPEGTLKSVELHN